MQTTSSRARGLVLSRLAKHGFTGDVGRRDSLTDAGLTSLDLVGLMLSVEGEFDIEIPTDMLTPANFRTLADIENLIVSLQPAS